MLRVMSLQRAGAALVLGMQNLAPIDEPITRFPLAGLVRSFPITAARVFPLAGKQRTFP